MNSNTVYTKRILGLDKQVWYVMMVAVILPLFLLSYRLIDKKECMPVEFSFRTISTSSGNIFHAGETISFKTLSNTDEITWDFGDKDNTEKRYGRYSEHIYKSPGEYYITASTGAGCENIKQVIIQAAPQSSDVAAVNTATGQEIVEFLQLKSAGLEFVTCMVSAGSYEWSIVNYPKTTKTGPSATLVFPGSGKFTVQVVLDHDRSRRYTKEIIVEKADDGGIKLNPLPPNPVPIIINDPAPVVKETPAKTSDTAAVVAPNSRHTIHYTGDAPFLEYLKKVVSKEWTVQNFDEYLCGSGGTPVVVNDDKDHPKTFAWLCNELATKKSSFFGLKKKTIKVESVHLHRINECVTLIEVQYK